jgi:hypothetical protein
MVWGCADCDCTDYLDFDPAISKGCREEVDNPNGVVDTTNLVSTQQPTGGHAVEAGVQLWLVAVIVGCLLVMFAVVLVCVLRRKAGSLANYATLQAPKAAPVLVADLESGRFISNPAIAAATSNLPLTARRLPPPVPTLISL